MSDIPIRIMKFEIDANHLRGNIALLLPLLGLSMTLPYLEPYLIRVMRQALKQATDPEVIRELKQFIGQEAQHYQQHKLVNDIVRTTSPELEGLQKLEDELKEDYRRFLANKSLKFNLAYAEGFEAATFASARNELKYNLWGGLKELEGTDLLQLLRWHLVEEIEHRTVTFDIYKHLYGGYLYRLVFGFYGQWHFFKYVYKFSAFIAENYPDAISRGQPAKWSALPRPGFMSAVSLLFGIIRTFSPWYNPAKMNLPEQLVRYSSQYSQQALEIRKTD